MPDIPNPHFPYSPHPNVSPHNTNQEQNSRALSPNPPRSSATAPPDRPLQTSHTSQDPTARWTDRSAPAGRHDTAASPLARWVGRSSQPDRTPKVSSGEPPTPSADAPPGRWTPVPHLRTSARRMVTLPAPKRIVRPGDAFDPAQAGDLRRRRERDLIETLVDRAVHLPAADRALVEAVYREGRPVVELAPLVGEPARVLRRRVRRLVTRLLSKPFLLVAAASPRWPRVRANVARLCVIEGLSMREAARASGLTLHTVRQHMRAVEAICEALANTPPSHPAAAHHPAPSHDPDADTPRP